MRSYGKLGLVIPAVLLVAAACSKTPTAKAGATGTPAGKASFVAVTQREWAIQPGVAAAPAGQVTFQVTDQGQVTHEFVVLRTDATPQSLQVESDGKAVETGHEGEVEDVAPGTSKTLTLNLAPGNYVLICNIPGHYQAGMHAAFTVT